MKRKCQNFPLAAQLNTEPRPEKTNSRQASQYCQFHSFRCPAIVGNFVTPLKDLRFLLVLAICTVVTCPRHTLCSCTGLGGPGQARVVVLRLLDFLMWPKNCDHYDLRKLCVVKNIRYVPLSYLVANVPWPP